MSSLIVTAPVQGWAASLDEVPDAVFAERMMGEGLAIDPTGATLYAPFDGEVAALPATAHAVVLRAENGAEVLIHVGLETVALGGEGFVAHVCEGQRIKAGERLLSFDLDFLAQHAKSLITPLVLTNGEAFEIVRCDADRMVAVGEAVMEVRPRGLAAATGAGNGAIAQRTITVMLEHGIHARPAATIAKAAQQFAAEVTARANGRRANAKSPVSLMTLGVRKGDELSIEAHGADAQAAIEAIVRAAVASEEAPARISTVACGEPASDGAIRGLCASPGLAVGVAAPMAMPEFSVIENGGGEAHERAALDAARVKAQARLRAAMASGDARRRDILGAHAALLDDPDLLDAARRLIASGKSAAFAWRAAVAQQANALAALSDGYMAERAADLRDLEAQVLEALGAVAPSLSLPENAIVLSHELLPSQFASLDFTRVAGICTATGGPTSHVALLAASMGVPAIVGAGERVTQIVAGAPLLLDADAGLLKLAPSKAETRAAASAAVSRRARDASARADAQMEARTADGVRIHVYANLGAVSEGAPAVARGAEGCGLLRTEFLFLDRSEPPGEDEQFGQYQAIADALEGRPLVVRTLDIGGDKPAPYLKSLPEENPALGVRGVRIGLAHPELLRTQLRAIARVRPKGVARILLPMVNDAAELRAVRALLAEIGGSDIQLGVMIETPSAALLADQLAADADFLSIGTNDLSQYALAMDRGHPDLAPAIDALHPAVLRLIAATTEGARTHRRSVAVCGAAASDPVATPLLLGLGVGELSVAPAAIAPIKARVRALSKESCRSLALEALQCADAREVRALAAARGGEGGTP